MNTLIWLILISGMNLYFLRNSSDLLVRYFPTRSTQQVFIYYSFCNAQWDSAQVQSGGDFFDLVISPPENLRLVGVYVKYPEGDIDDNQGMLYLYEVKKSPRMLLPFSIKALEKVLTQARKKIINQRHIDEAVALLNYAEGMLEVLPYIKGSPLEMEKEIMKSEIAGLKKNLAQ
ncbi:MAG: hypothetical protein ABIL70_04685 [candidate division WOR-3 bacterium]